MKRIILCSDGTWNKPGKSRNTNVLKFARAVLPLDDTPPPGDDGMVFPIHQVVFYDAGVGSGNVLDQVSGGAFGSGLDKNIKDVYRFLANNYVEGDEIFLIGFSRGAFTSRSAGGLIRNSGVLRKEHLDRLEEAFDLYRDSNVHPRGDVAVAFRDVYSYSPRVRFLGVFDTVGALGILLAGLRDFVMAIPGLGRWHRRKFQFHNTDLSSTVDHAFHAVAIDEHRGAFDVALWSAPTPPKETDDRPPQVVQQIWFAGDHSNVGGGHKDSELSDIALRGMADAAHAAGLRFDGSLPNPEELKPRGKLYESPQGFYKRLPQIDRGIGAQHEESVSPHVMARRDQDSSYAPQNLKDYLDGRP
jgi:uncharacterized protein (DUF2235 family)